MASVGSICFDWTRCVFCQKVTRDKTVCPGLSKRTDFGAGYRTLSEQVISYKQLGSLPPCVDLSIWDEGDGVEKTCIRNQACWHAKCRALLHSTHLDRLRKHIHVADVIENKVHNEHSSVDVSSDEYETPLQLPRLTRSCSGFVETAFSSVCFFCEKEGKNNRRTVLTMPVDKKVRACADIINDPNLLSKLAHGGLICNEAQYHPSCLLAVYDKASRMQKATQEADFEVESPLDIDAESFALADIIAYMEEVRANEHTPSVFKLSTLIDLYMDQLKLHGVHDANRTHATRFKERLLENCPDLTEVNHGRDVLLTFSENLGIALTKLTENSDCSAVLLMHTAKLIRNEIFGSKQPTFNGTFSINSQTDAVPKTLLSHITLLLEGPGIFEVNDSQAALSISQLIIFNAVKRQRRSLNSDVRQKSSCVRHSQNQETPLPIYLGLMLHSATRKKKIVDKCYRLGLSVSYDRVIQIVTKLGNSVCAQYNSEHIVCPPVLKTDLFTVAAVDNIDHNTSSNTAKSSFHGTAISLMQFRSEKNMGVDRGLSQNHSLEEASSLASEIVLPLSYSDVPPCVFTKPNPAIPSVQFNLAETISDTTESEYDWLAKVMVLVEDNNLEPLNITWAGHHAEISTKASQPLPVFAMLPLFRHSANTVAMIRHSLTVVRSAVHRLNPKQIPVVTFDQPLYALAKQIQWHWPELFGEDKFVVMMGGLHIEMAALKMLGNWLDGSGWVQCLVNACIATSGVADSFIHATHVKRTRYAHTVTAATLFICQQHCYSKYCNTLPENERLSYDQWCVEQKQKSVQFMYWDKVLGLELLVLTFIRSIREGNFELYVKSLQNLSPWFFSLDHTHYARWMSVHLRDMLNLKVTHPSIAAEFLASNFTISKSNRHFSNIAIDHAHEQLNAIIKDDGGAVGLTESDAALNRWIVAGPEIIRILNEFEGNINLACQDRTHHEQKPACQKRFKQDVMNLLDIFDQNDNPFNETASGDLLSLDSHTLADASVSLSVKTAYQLGTKQMNDFFQQRFHGSVSIHDPLAKNKLPLFTFKPASKKQSASRLRVAELKTDCQLFSQLYIACQSRDSDLAEFFKYENQACPPSLSQRGTLRFGTKSDLLACFSLLSKISNDVATVDVNTYVLDGAVIIQMLQPGGSRIFEEYYEKVFIPYINCMLMRVERVDIVFDVYLPNSLKSATREKRGYGTRTRVMGNTKIPKNWQDFLRVDANKTELFHFLAETVSKSNSHGKQIVVTYDDHVKCTNAQLDTSSIDPCNHEEADMRLILHCSHAAQNGSKKIAIRTVDTDVVVLAVAFFSRLNLEELWIHCGVGKNVRFVAAHDLSNALGPRKCLALPAFHCLTGCDTTSSFGGKGKKTAWEAWNAYPVVTEAFINLSNVNDCLSDATMAVLERFIIVMYDRTSDCIDLDTARMNMFTKKSKSLESLPPTSDAFKQHVKRTVYQAIHCWGQCLEKYYHIPSPSDWGWTKDGDYWVPLWMTLPEVSLVCSELIHCGCKKGCVGNCKCVKSNLVCTALCQCGGTDKCIRK